MKITIRRGVFETNSSSTHSITICSLADYRKWEAGDFLFQAFYNKLVPKDEVFAELKEMEEYNALDFSDEEAVAKALKEQDYLTFEEYEKYFEDFDGTFVEDYTSESGDEIVAFGYYSGFAG